jgi:secreted PhoX family phosphatase
MAAAFTANDIARNPTRFSRWPTTGARPRSATVMVRRSDGGVIGG